MVQIGDRYKERMVPFPGQFFSWEYEVIGFRQDPYAKFAVCNWKIGDGVEREVGISIELLEAEHFYKKIN